MPRINIKQPELKVMEKISETRIIKFRGKRVDNGEWVYGYYVVDPSGKHRIYLQPFEDATSNTYYFVIPETVGQFTGMNDKRGTEIYEDDILECHEYDSSDTGRGIVQTFKNAVVGFTMGSYYYFPKGNMKQGHQLLMYAYKPVVISNIHDNPELLTPKNNPL